MSDTELVILDLDDTLCDYASAKTRALEQAMAPFASSETERAQMIGRYLELEPALFRKFANGDLDLADYRRQRFQQVLSKRESEDRIDAANARYMAGANAGINLFPDAQPLLHALAGRGLNVAILTNGPSGGQRVKLRATGLDHLVETVFISEETGFSKPDRAAFLNVANRFSVAPAACLMVGDDFGNDIEPARKLGMRGLHLVRNGVSEGEHIVSLAEVVSHLDESRCISGVREKADRQ